MRLIQEFWRGFFRRIEKIEFFRLSFCNLKNNRALLRVSANFSAINIVRETQQAFTGRSIAPNMTQIWQTPIIWARWVSEEHLPVNNRVTASLFSEFSLIEVDCRRRSDAFLKLLSNFFKHRHGVRSTLGTREALYLARVAWFRCEPSGYERLVKTLMTEIG